MGISTGWQTLNYEADLAWAGAAPDPSMGNGTATLRYRRVDGFFYLNFRFVAGSTTTFGGTGGRWLWNLPEEIGATSPYAVGGAWARDLNATVLLNSDYAGIAVVENSGSPGAGYTPKLTTIFGTATGYTDGTHPFTWSAGSFLVASVIVEAFDN